MSNCYRWPLDPGGPALADDAALEELAAGYEALADAVELADRVRSGADLQEFLSPALVLAAEAQSALRAAGWGVRLAGGGRDQLETHRLAHPLHPRPCHFL